MIEDLHPKTNTTKAMPWPFFANYIQLSKTASRLSLEPNIKCFTTCIVDVSIISLKPSPVNRASKNFWSFSSAGLWLNQPLWFNRCIYYTNGRFACKPHFEIFLGISGVGLLACSPLISFTWVIIIPEGSKVNHEKLFYFLKLCLQNFWSIYQFIGNTGGRRVC